MRRKQVNEHFFDVESKEMWYVLGISFAKYNPERGGNRNTWTSSDEDLLEIVKTSLQSEAKKGRPTKKGSRNFQFRNQYLHDKLIERGCIYNKSERTFPENCEEQYLDHFVRGFFDGNVSVSTDNYTSISYPSVSFLQKLYPMLVSHASVRAGRQVTKSPLQLRGQDVIAVHNFIYRDWDFIQEHGLYLLSKKERFKI